MSFESTSRELLDRIERLSPKRLALLAAELERRLAAREESAVEPIAVTGLACRMPGGVDTPDAFWDLLANGRDAIEIVPPSRWNAGAVYSPITGMPGKANTKWGGFINGIDQFDASFFGIAPREANGMDPQQRMLLEVSWEALENAGERADRLNGSHTGVFVGMSTNDYAMLMGDDSEQEFGAYSGTGLARSVAAGRISYFLGLRGPNLSVDTACSSSAVAIHLACQSLRQGDCRLALAGGVNAILAPQLTITLAQARMLASDGRCKTFSKSADGFVRSEGCGMIVLKRLPDAEADGDRILGLIRGSAVNHDGRSSGLTAPNGPAQEAVVKAALSQARLMPDEIDYVEAHGTGTVLGDAIELGSLGACFGERNSSRAPLLIGSLKTNIGHLEAAAGVASVIKVLLSFQHRSLPPHLHVSEGCENEALRSVPLQLPLRSTPWPVTTRPSLAGVSSFGFSGTNAHIILEAAAQADPPRSNQHQEQIITLSAKSLDALSALCMRHATYLQRHPQTDLSDFAFTLNTGRSHFQHRVAFLTTSVSDAISLLEQIADQGLLSHPSYRFVSSYDEPSIGFLFTGQGSQYAGMGRDLYQSSAVFRAAIDQCDDVLAGKLAYKLSKVLCGDESVPVGLINETQWAQPALFAFEYALALLWNSWGVRPSVAIGHSLGEYVAACVAGVFTVEAALALAFERGRLMGSLPRNGAMLAIRAEEAEIAGILEEFSDLSIAAINSDRNVVVAGRSEQIESLRTELSARGVSSQPLTVSHAFHSAEMDPILDAFEREAEKLVYGQPEIPLISNVSGQLFRPGEQIDASYWRRHIRDTVRFSPGLSSLLTLHPVALLEIGPDPVLSSIAKPELMHSQIACLPSLRRGKNASHSMKEALVQLYLLGSSIEWSRVHRDRPVRKLALPTYPFQRQRYWITTAKKFAPAETGVASVPGTVCDPFLYTTEWQVQETPALSAPEQLIEAAEACMRQISEDCDAHQELLAYDEFLPQLNRLCSLYILMLLRSLNVDPRRGLRLSVKDTHIALGIKPEYRRLVERLFAILQEDAIVRRTDDFWEFLEIPIGEAASAHATIAATFPQFRAELAFLRQASHLADVLQGKMSAMEALFPNGSLVLAEQVYQESPAARAFNRALSEVVRRTVESCDGLVKIVEIGAGTGSTTSQILPALKGKQVEYLFTDISPAFFEPARAKFAQYPFVRYQILDIEKQDQIPSVAMNADIVIAANVLHATADLTQTIAALRQILRPGGSLVVLEGTAPQRFGDLTVGMTDGWWRYTDIDRRPVYPLMKRQQWLDLFHDFGFQASALEENGPVKTLARQQTILVAQPQHTVTEHSVSSVILFKRSSQTESLTSSLKSLGIEVLEPDDNHNSLRDWPVENESRSPVLIDLTAANDHSGVANSVFSYAIGAVELLKQLIENRSFVVPIWLLTRGVSATNKDERIDLSAAASGAIVKTTRLEYPELPLFWVDLPIEPGTADFARLVQLIRKGTKEHLLAIRNGKISVPRLVYLRATSSSMNAGLKASPGAAYLVTGAYGGLGFRTVQWLVDRGATCIFMVGRHLPSHEMHDQIATFRASGITLHELVGDISERHDVEMIFERISNSSLELKGIVHAAGVLDDGTLLQQTREKFEKVFAPKVRGAWLLHEFSRSHPIEFFVLFGSAASTLGSAGQINHATANGFLDALSHYRRNEGLPSTTIAWGAWSEIGAASRMVDTGRSGRLGLNAITPERGIDLLEKAIQSGRAEVTALSVDWQIYLDPGKAHSDWPFFEKVSPRAAEYTVPQPIIATLKSRLESAPSSDRLAIIKTHLKDRIVQVLALKPGTVIGDNLPFGELGLDSLMALELKNELQTATGMTLPPNFLFEYHTLQLASAYLNAMLVVAPSESHSRSDSSEFEEFAL